MTQASQHPPVKTRKVFYIPGYDPFHARRYRELYRTEGQAQAAISGYDIVIKGDPGREWFGWDVAAVVDDQKTTTQIEVLVWSDIVRDSMSPSIIATYWQLLTTSWLYLRTGTLRRLMWLRKGPVIAALFPVVVLLLQLLAAILAGVLAAALLVAGLGWLLGLFGWFPATALSAIRWVTVLAVSILLLRWFKANDRRIFAHYLMHDYAFSAGWKGANPPPLEPRLQEFGQRIAAALQSDVDEVLVVGHSSGAHLAVHILSGLIRQGRVPKTGPALGFLSLGQVIPMVSFLPKANRLRADLAFLSTREEITWIDVTAPGDGCAFALCDPVAVSGVAPVDKRWPLVISAAFTQTLSPEKWQSLRWRFFRLHFQYLCAFDQPGDYDYFQITAGPLTLSDRFAGRKPSMSRIDVPASKYTGTVG